ncbi:MAG: hypothetical protein DRJ98_05410 [Thermoprotei archaeon]|nr:MAG: hypothetical protein DRJ98_05410 [Thermoprotei archaeon]
MVRWEPELGEQFVRFLKSKKRPTRNEKNIRRVLSYLDRYMPAEGISRPEQVFEMFMRCPETTRHHLDRAFRNLLNFYRRVLGYPRDFIEDLKEAIPAARGDFEDRWVPGEDLIIQSLKELRDKHVKSFVFLNAQLDCTTRPMHLAEMLESFDPARIYPMGRVECPRCGYKGNRHVTACLNMLRTSDVDLWFGPERLSHVAMTLALTNPSGGCGKAKGAKEGKLNRGHQLSSTTPYSTEPGDGLMFWS